MHSLVTCNTENCVALILAGGYGKRFGQDKRRVPMDHHQTLLGSTLKSVQNTFKESYVVIRDDDQPSQLGLNESTKIIYSTRSDKGLGASLSTGIEFIQSSKFSAVAIFLGDMPWIDSTTLEILVNAARRSRIVLPTFQGQPGHPVIFGRQFWPELLSLNDDKGAKSIVSRHHNNCVFIPVKDSGILRDVDVPDDLTINDNYKIPL
ncbi:NTP transferase domain-containing protein [Vibrio natriegens]|uniref:nucleotidyltransferase family protein n=1 Tax=Vibrio natriegens TaxID=691 RepID=UPI00355787C6